MVDIALIGAGRIGKIHGGNLARQAGMRLRYVCDAVPQAASELAARLGAGVATLDQVFSDGAVQAVSNASPTHTPPPLIPHAPAARPEIFCEKTWGQELGPDPRGHTPVAQARPARTRQFPR